MRARHSVLLVFGLAFLLLVAPTAAVGGPPQEAAGHWEYFVFDVEVKEAGCNTFLTTVDEGFFTGTIEGSYLEQGLVVAHCNGATSFNGLAVFEEATVQGLTGGLVISVNGWTPDADSWFGNWVVIRGTGDLAHLHGQGTWWGPGAGGPFVWGDLDYEGSIHFAPGG